MLRSLAEACCGPAETLTKLNRLLVDDFPAGKFVTLVYAVLDPAARTVTFANAGHLHPLLITSNGSRFVNVERGLPLGLSCGDYSECTLNLPEGSRFVLYSDGMTEALNADGEEYGLARLAAHAISREASALSISDNVQAFTEGSALADDASVVFIGAGS